MVPAAIPKVQETRIMRKQIFESEEEDRIYNIGYDAATQDAFYPAIGIGIACVAIGFVLGAVI